LKVLKTAKEKKKKTPEEAFFFVYFTSMAPTVYIDGSRRFSEGTFRRGAFGKHVEIA
jgi:hypothetical protein